MRTTLDIDAEVLAIARNLAETCHISLGKALSTLARRGARAQTLDNSSGVDRDSLSCCSI
jgi:hypothetical protein